MTPTVKAVGVCPQPAAEAGFFVTKRQGGAGRRKRIDQTVRVEEIFREGSC
jgi:hypothetical protein